MHEQQARVLGAEGSMRGEASSEPTCINVRNVKTSQAHAIGTCYRNVVGVKRQEKWDVSQGAYRWVD
jgi:hypothetical protein